jgi:hypothetical protein
MRVCVLGCVAQPLRMMVMPHEPVLSSSLFSPPLFSPLPLGAQPNTQPKPTHPLTLIYLFSFLPSLPPSSPLAIFLTFHPPLIVFIDATRYPPKRRPTSNLFLPPLHPCTPSLLRLLLPLHSPHGFSILANVVE